MFSNTFIVLGVLVLFWSLLSPLIAGGVEALQAAVQDQMMVSGIVLLLGGMLLHKQIERKGQAKKAEKKAPAKAEE